MTSLRDRIATERRAEILDAATRLFVRKGIEGATLQDIAAEVELTASAIYRYFPSKEALVDAVFAECEAANSALFDQARTATRSPLEAIHATGQSAWEMFHAPGARQQMALGLEVALAAYRDEAETGNRLSATASHLRSLIVHMTTLAEQARAAGELDRALSPRDLAITLLALHYGLQYFVVQLDGEVDTDGAFDVLSAMLNRLTPERRSR